MRVKLFDQQNLKEFVNSRLALKEMLKDVLQTERKYIIQDRSSNIWESKIKYYKMYIYCNSLAKAKIGNMLNVQQKEVI